MKKLFIFIALMSAATYMQAMDNQGDNQLAQDNDNPKTKRIVKRLRKASEQELKEAYYLALSKVQILNDIIARDAWQGEFAKKELPKATEKYIPLKQEMIRRGLLQ